MEKDIEERLDKIEEFMDILFIPPNYPSIIDRGYFNKTGFFSTMFNTKCRCKSRNEHIDKCLSNTFILMR